MSHSPPTAIHRQNNRHGCYRQTASSYVQSWRSGDGDGGAFTAIQEIYTMKIRTTFDNTAAIEFLKIFHPQWIDEMPVTASIRSPGKSNIAQNAFFDGEKRQGVLTLYFGQGCVRDDGGWFLLVVSEATEAEFNAAAMVHSALASVAAGLPPTEGFTLE